MNNTIRKLTVKERVTNAMKNQYNLSSCRYCGGAWNWKKRYAVRLNKSNGTFPCCKDCWPKMTLNERLDAMTMLFGEWHLHGLDDASSHPLSYYLDAVRRDFKNNHNPVVPSKN